MIGDEIPGNVDVSYSNISEQWVASFFSEREEDKGTELAKGFGSTRIEALEALCNALEIGNA